MSMPGDVIVVSNEGERSRAIMGEIMYNYMQGFKKIAGIVGLMGRFGILM